MKGSLQLILRRAQDTSPKNTEQSRSAVYSLPKKVSQIKARVLQNTEVAPGFFKLRIAAPLIAKYAVPGQFLNIKVNNTYEPLLRKPLGIHKINSSLNEIEVLYKLVGKGTQILSQRKRKEFLDVLGPLGNGFSSLDFARDPEQSEGILDTRFLILVGGGIGIAPLVFLAETLAHSPSLDFARDRQPTAHSKPLALIGAKTKKEILCEKEFKALGCEVKIATDDGSRGFKGNITDLLKMILRGMRDLSTSLRAGEGRGTVYACGPKPMLKAIAQLSRQYQLKALGSLEEYMACGTGACFGCVVKTTKGYKRVCNEGPVFDLREIEW